MATRETIVARLAEWGLTLSEREIDQLIPAYENLLRWQGVLEDMMHSRKVGRGDDGAGERADPDSRDRAIEPDERTERMNT